jgi:hypothetical protein
MIDYNSFIVYFNPAGETTVVMAPEGLSPALRPRIKAISILLRAIQAPAAIFQSDTRQVNMDKFLDYFRLGGLKVSAAKQVYSRILTEQFGGSVANMPRALWYDAIITCLRGPKLPVLGLSTVYRGGPDNTCVFEPTRERGVLVNVLPEWWDTTAQ